MIRTPFGDNEFVSLANVFDGSVFRYSEDAVDILCRRAWRISHERLRFGQNERDLAERNK